MGAEPSPPAAPPEVRAPRTLGCLVAALSAGAFACAFLWVPPLLTLIASVIALVQIKRQPSRYGGAGFAKLGIGLSLLAGAFVLIMRPYVGERGDLRYGYLMNRKSASSMEASAIGSLRELISAETAYQAENGGAAATLDCLRAPTHCTPPLGADKPAYVMNWPGATTEADWVASLDVPAAPAGQERYAVTLVPKAKSVSGEPLRAFCGDSSGDVRFTPDGSPPRVVAGLCDPALPRLY